MITLQGDYVQTLIAPATISSGATTSARINRANYNYAVIDLIMPAATSTVVTNAYKWLTLTLGEDDTTSISNATNITAFVGTTNSTSATGFVIPAQNDTTNPQILRLMVDCKARKKNLFLTVMAPTTAAAVAVIAQLIRPEQLAAIDSKRGVNTVTVIG